MAGAADADDHDDDALINHVLYVRETRYVRLLNERRMDGVDEFQAPPAVGIDAPDYVYDAYDGGDEI